MPQLHLLSSFSETVCRQLYFGCVIQFGGGTQTSTTVSTLRPLIRFVSVAVNLLGRWDCAKNVMDMSPPTFVWLGRGLRGSESPWVGVTVTTISTLRMKRLQVFAVVFVQY